MLGGEESPHRVYLRVGHFGRAVDLAEERGLRAHDPAGSLALGGADRRRFVQRLAGDAALATRQINDGHRMPEGRVTRQRPAAPRLRIVRMPADTHDGQARRVGPAWRCHQRQRVRSHHGRTDGNQ